MPILQQAIDWLTQPTTLNLWNGALIVIGVALATIFFCTLVLQSSLRRSTSRLRTFSDVNDNLREALEGANKIQRASNEQLSLCAERYAREKTRADEVAKLNKDLIEENAKLTEALGVYQLQPGATPSPTEAQLRSIIVDAVSLKLQRDQNQTSPTVGPADYSAEAELVNANDRIDGLEHELANWRTANDELTKTLDHMTERRDEAVRRMQHLITKLSGENSYPSVSEVTRAIREMAADVAEPESITPIDAYPPAPDLSGLASLANQMQHAGGARR